jgi:hypothetical protein
LNKSSQTRSRPADGDILRAGAEASFSVIAALQTLVCRRPRKRWFVLAAIACLAIILIAAYREKDEYGDHVAEASRSVIGQEATARVESWYFAGQDRFDRIKFRVFGAPTNPFPEERDGAPVAAEAAVTEPAEFQFSIVHGGQIETVPALALKQPAKPAPLVLPETRALGTKPGPGEGVWVTSGLPRSSPEDVLMAKTFVRPDPARPYALAGVLLLDKRRIRLHITGGTQSPGGDLGVKGSGVIPETDRKDVLAAWNGGFQGPHGGFGMIADGKQYRPLRNGYASVAVFKDGTIQMGEWGRDLSWSPEMLAVRQNAVLLVDNCEVSRRTNEGNNTWGYVQVNSAEFITWRSAIGLTKNGDLMVAAGNSLSAASLARALWAAGACYAMQLDINSPYVLTSLYFPQENGSLKQARFMDSMPDASNRFFTIQPRDFMYATLNDKP